MVQTSANPTIADLYELSPLQQGIWFQVRQEPESSLYFEQFSCTLHGELDVAAFVRAWQQVVDRHPVLRTSFHWQDLPKPLQVVHRQATLPFDQHDWRHLSADEQADRLNAYLIADRQRGFNLSQAPLMRISLIWLAAAAYRLVWSHHHLLLDGWSNSLLLQEVLGAYDAIRQGRSHSFSAPRPYRDYIAWLQQQDRSQAERFWQQTLAGMTATTPLPMNQVGGRSPQYAQQRLSLSAKTTAALQQFARQQQITLNTMVQAAWGVLLSRYSGVDDVLFGATVSGRPPTLTGAERMIGLFINTLPVRLTVSPTAQVSSWLRQFQLQQAELRQYEHSALTDIQRWSEIPPGQPLFDSIVVFENYPLDQQLTQQASHLRVSQIQIFEQTHYPLTLIVAPGRELSLKLLYRRDRLSADRALSLLHQLHQLLELMAQAESRLADLNGLTAAETQQILSEWNQTQVNYPLRSLPEWWQLQVARSPDAVAVITPKQQITFQQLNQQVNQLAHYLQGSGVGRGNRVAICLERSIEQIISIFGVLKAGAAYVPLDPSYPSDRLNWMLHDAQVNLLITSSALQDRLKVAAVPVLDWQQLSLDAYPAENLDISVQPDDLAYLIYTSGSTGNPKGVMAPYRGLLNRCQWMWQTYPFKTGDICCQKTSISFVDAVWEVFGALLQGVPLLLIPDAVVKDPPQFVQMLANYRVTRLVLVPSLLRALLTVPDVARQLAHLRLWISSGEALKSELRQQFQQTFPEATLLNLYGSSEVAADATWAEVQGATGDTESIGRAIANTDLYLLDRQLQPVPIGAIGELYIGGAGLAQGYWQQSDWTADRFIPHPFTTKPGERLYRTGDLGRYRADGQVEFVGRADQQIKLRGYRIELGEVEAIAAQYPAVAQAVVTVQSNIKGEPQLVAYGVPHSGQSLDGQQWRSYLQRQLPAWMVPTLCVELAELPLLPNGKVNRRALPTPRVQQLDAQPQSATERQLVDIWTAVLGLESVGIHDDFFALGGHSLLATQVQSRIRDTLQGEVPLRQLFETPTIAALAQFIDADLQTQSEPAAIAPVPRDQPLPLSFAQQRLWFLDQMNPGSPFYNIPAAVRLTGALDRPALERSFQEVVRRHEVLRTRFAIADEQPVQVVEPAGPLPIPLVDLRHLTPAEQDQTVKQMAIAAAQQPFDLRQAPLLRVTLLQLEVTHHVVLVTLHHIVADGWSMGILIREVATLYAAFSTGKPSPLPELPIQYADFAVWQRRWLQGERRSTHLRYWTQRLGSNPPVLQLPSDRPRTASHPFQGATRSFQISPDLTQQVRQFSQDANVTLFMAALTAFQILLHRQTAQTDLVLGTDVANRNHQETEKLIGFFVNLLALRTDLSGNPTVRSLLDRVRDVTLGAYAHQDLPFEQLVETLQPHRTSSHTPLVQVLFVLQVPIASVQLPGLSWRSLDLDYATTKFDLAVFLAEQDQGLDAVWQYNAALFDTDTIDRLAHRFEQILRQIVQQPDARIHSLDILTNAEREQRVMEKRERKAINFDKFKQIKPKAVSLAQEHLIQTQLLRSESALPLMVQPAVADLDIVDWASNHRPFLEETLLKQGAILFRDCQINQVTDFERFAQAICSELFAEYGDLPRAGVSGKVYGSTPYPAEQTILFHNESSHLHRFPLKIWFYCVQPAQQGGETPIVDCRQLYQRLNPELRDRLLDQGLLYVRNYIEGLDVRWQDFFHTDDPAVVEAYCQRAGIEVEWISERHLRTRKRCAAITRHPKTGEWVFFNQLQLHHIACLDPAVRRSLLSLFDVENLPRHVYYGDGSPIADSVVEHINQLYRDTAIAFPWQQGDVLMLDNMLVAHSRNPFVGQRKIVVAMGEMTNAPTVGAGREVHAN